VERREATRFLFAEEAKQDICALRRSMPLVVSWGATERKTRAWRESNDAWLFEN
jgi:hypothetical protein